MPISDEIIGGLVEFVNALEAGDEIDVNVRCHRVRIGQPPETPSELDENEENPIETLSLILDHCWKFQADSGCDKSRNGLDHRTQIDANPKNAPTIRFEEPR